MSSSTETIDSLVRNEYKYGWTTDIESDTLEAGLNEDVVRFISRKKNEPDFLLQWRLKAFRHWQKMSEPKWPHVKYPPHRFSVDQLLFCAEKKGGRSQVTGRSGSETAGDLCEAWDSSGGAENVVRCGGGCGV